jgi:adenine-specific DNA-methyltransferase
MAQKKTNTKRPIESYEHRDKERANNPPVGLVTPETDPDAGQKKKRYAYDPHLDPQLVWAGKAEHTSFEVPTVSLHVHERIEPRSIIKAVRKVSGQGIVHRQLSLFETERREPLRQAVEFYRHKHGWTNRLIAGDSLLVMNSLLEKEGMAGKVQMIYIDPPYGIKYGSNFQPFVNKRDVKDGKDEDLTAEPEQIRAFRDTWELGIHSYLTYLRDRLLWRESC